MGLSDTLKAINDPVRRAILEFLKKGDASAGTIADQFDLTQATVSYHLKLLRQAESITVKKDKNFVIYHLSASVFEDLLAWLYTIGGTPHDN